MGFFENLWDVIAKKAMFPDDTVDRIQRQLLSDVGFEPVIQAVGQPGLAAIEVLVIGKSFIRSVKSTPDYFVISQYKRIK